MGQVCSRGLGSSNQGAGHPTVICRSILPSRRASRNAYAGDELAAIGRLSLCGWGAWYFPLPALAMWPKPFTVESARKLLSQ